MEERCEVSCGCGRKGTNRATRIKQQTTKTIKARKRNLRSARGKLATISPLTSNSAICLSCIESRQTPDERKRGIRVCHKTNRLINNIIRDQRFSCPLGKWKKSK